MVSASRRTQRMAVLVREELSKLLLEEVSDPRIHDVSVRHVEMTGDLKLAKVFVEFQVPQAEVPLVAGPKTVQECLSGLRHAAPFLRRKLGEKLDLRFTPELRFSEDTEGRAMDKLGKLLTCLESPLKGPLTAGPEN